MMQVDKDSSLDIEHSLPSPEEAATNAILSKPSSLEIDDADVVTHTTVTESMVVDQSLPSPEEARSNLSSFTGGARWYSFTNRNRVSNLICLSLSTIFILAVISLALRMKTRDARNTNSDTTTQDGMDPMLYKERLEIATDVVFQNIPGYSTSVFNDTSSPQFQALDIIAKTSEEIIPLPLSLLDIRLETTETNRDDISKLVQLYVMSVLYYSTNGNDWSHDSGFFQNSNVCQWNNRVFDGSTGSIFSSGVFCEDDSTDIQYLVLNFNNAKGELPSELSNAALSKPSNSHETAPAVINDHSLPSPEEARSNLSSFTGGRTWHSFTNRVSNMIILGLGIVLILIMISVAARLHTRNTATNSNSDTTTFDINLYNERLEIAIDVVFQNIPGYSPSIFNDTSSPQFQALDIIARTSEEIISLPLSLLDIQQETSDDVSKLVQLYVIIPLPLSLLDIRLETTETNRDDISKLVQLYVMSVLYYSTNGNDWSHDSGFFQNSNVCEWNNRVFDGSTGSIFSSGVFCEDDSTDIQYLVLNFNNAKGELPSELGVLTELKAIMMLYNGLTGTLPDLSKLSELQGIYLDGNRLSGALPDWLGQLPQLQEISLGENQFTGTIPELTQLTKLGSLRLQDNLLTGDLVDPNSSLSKLSTDTLVELQLEDNGFQGNLQQNFLKKLLKGNLTVLDISDNELTGKVSFHIFESESLMVLDLHGNKIDNIDTIIPPNNVLQFLALHENLIKKHLPDNLHNLQALTHLDLSNNKLKGTIPNGLSKMTKLTYLFLAKNDFLAGTIPPFLGNLTSLEELSLKDTQLTGTIPTDVFSTRTMTNLTLLDLDSNALTGTIPPELASLEQLRFLLLNRNNLNGTIPLAFATSSVYLFLVDNNTLTGDMSFLCGSDYRRDKVIADCAGETPEIVCEGSCCECCDDGDDLPCNGLEMLANLDPVWQTSYGRYHFDFDIQQYRVVHNNN
eukprot:CAMPEP_0194393626 /NCGR_PEP_ID=MMETSP0174-20130528/123402_1 /TAXON_ID=216777 /ORGANISM="Proboscia alata, Strain PI-D3" /LENGTH=962 /DNA_ID=CAMNT_0039189331 /DNA_START=60 /DNA_END=2948 /DNA_ORIENTATION=-